MRTPVASPPPARRDPTRATHRPTETEGRAHLALQEECATVCLASLFFNWSLHHKKLRHVSGRNHGTTFVFFLFTEFEGTGTNNSASNTIMTLLKIGSSVHVRIIKRSVRSRTVNAQPQPPTQRTEAIAGEGLVVGGNTNVEE